MADAPTPDELGPLLGITGNLDDAPAGDAAPDDEGGEFTAAAMTAVGTRQKADALRDAIEAYCREKGLIQEGPEPEGETPDTATAPDIGAGFEDY